MTFKTTLQTTALALALALTGMSGPALAQDDDDDGTIRMENVTIVNVRHVAFKPGKRTRAMAIINDHFATAAQAADLPGPLFTAHSDTGKWDIILVWEMKGGFDDLMWVRGPNGVAWYNALVEQEGGADEAQALLDEYSSLVAHTNKEVGHVHNPDDGDDE